MTPGSGTPMQPHGAEAKCAVVAPGAVSVVPHDAVSGTARPRHVVGDRPQAVPQRLGQRRGGVEHEAQAREEGVGEVAVGLEAGRAARSPRARCSRRWAHLAQGRDRLVERAGGGPAVVDVQRAAEARIWPRLWLAPNVWLHGSQSTSTGGSAPGTATPARAIRWLAHSMPWVLITPFGAPVEPDVNRSFATVCGPTAAARRRPPVGRAARRARRRCRGEHDRRAERGERRRTPPASSANTSPGSHSAAMRGLAVVAAEQRVGRLTGRTGTPAV